jgi:hypothetical protein
VLFYSLGKLFYKSTLKIVCTKKVKKMFDYSIFETVVDMRNEKTSLIDLFLEYIFKTKKKTGKIVQYVYFK